MKTKEKPVSGLLYLGSVALTIISLLELLFITLPAPTMDIMRVTEPIIVYDRKQDEEGQWHFEPITLPENAICVVRRKLKILGPDEGKYIEVLTDYNNIWYIKTSIFECRDEIYIQGLHILSFQVPPPGNDPY